MEGKAYNWENCLSLRTVTHNTVTMNAVVLISFSIIYTLLFLSILVAYIFGWVDFQSLGFHRIYSVSCWLMRKLVPKLLRNFMTNTCSYILYERNPVIQILYATLLFAGYAAYTVTVYPFVSESILGRSPFYLLAVNLFLFAACCCSNPGVITKDNHHKLLKDYEYDGTMFTPQDCHTCLLKKPARSKHCSVCNVCIARFDHHCSWVNSCIGKYNYRYFIGFILSLVLMCGVSSFMIVMVFFHLVDVGGLHLTQYTDKHGNIYDATLGTILQYLVATFPLMSILLIFLVSLFLLLGGFFLFHTYLTLTNQTTNELFAKRHKLLSSEATSIKGGAKSTRKFVRQMRANQPGRIFGWYSKGMFRNLFEVLFPEWEN